MGHQLILNTEKISDKFEKYLQKLKESNYSEILKTKAFLQLKTNYKNSKLLNKTYTECLQCEKLLKKCDLDNYAKQRKKIEKRLLTVQKIRQMSKISPLSKECIKFITYFKELLSKSKKIKLDFKNQFDRDCIQLSSPK